MEKALLGAILLKPELVMPYCRQIGLTSQMFQDSDRRKIYRVINKQHDDQKGIDSVIISQLSGYPLSAMNDLMDACPLDLHGGDYADKVRDQHVKRQIADLKLVVQDIATNDTPARESLEELQSKLDAIKTIDTSFLVRSLTDYANAEIDESKTLLGNRFLCREGGMLFIGPSGVGKSSASVQQDILWSLGLPAFGITPARPLKIATIQAENDDGDLTEMARGIMDGLELTIEQREQVRQNTFYVAEKAKTGIELIRFLDSVLHLTRPDIIRLDPLQSYVGGDTSDVEVISAFVHTGLNPLLQTYQCAAIINHHTPKTNIRDTTKWRASDWQYAGAGSAVLTNWARAIVIVDPCKDSAVLFRFIAAKRAWRTGWVDENGEKTMLRYFRHARDSGVIFWQDASADEISLANAPKSKYDILALVPQDGSIPKDALIEKAKTADIGMNKARKFINELLEEKSLYSWKVNRGGGTRQQVELARFEQPEPTLV